MGRPYAGFCPNTRERGCVTVIYLGTTLPQPSSGLPGNSTSRLKHSLSDLAPGEVYQAGQVTLAPGGLLHHRFTLTAGITPVAVCSLWHCLAGCPGWVLPTALLCGARTFLGTRGILSGCSG